MGHTSGGSIAPMTRTFGVLRGPAGTPERVEEYRIGAGPDTTVLDALVDVQRTQDPTLAFRYACRVGMCGSCAMVVNGRERWACRTRLAALGDGPVRDRKSTRLNSSHGYISYAVFCLKKKKRANHDTT